MGLRKKNDEGRMSSVLNLLHRLDNEPSHAEQVTKIALQLFDELKSLHGLKEKDRLLLQAAALLHDIGWLQGAQSHHKSSMKLILKNDLLGWTDEEKLIIANIARYHRKALPKEKHSNFARLSDTAKQKVRKLASLLRIADGLDRSHGNYVKKVKCRLAKDQVKMTIYALSDLSAEIYGFEKKRDLFRETFGIPIVIDKIEIAL